MSSDPGLRFYRTLLRLFPRAFREDFGPEMVSLFAEMRTELRDGTAAALRFWVRLTWDTCAAAVAEWAGLFRSRATEPGNRPRGASMSTLASDIRISLRQLGRNPGYAVTVVFLMAVGIAGNAAVFRVFNGLFLRPLPFADSGRLVDLDETAPQWDLEFLSIAYHDFDAWRAENSSFESMAVFTSGGGNFLADEAPRRVDYLSTSHDLMEVLKLEPHLGRFYGPEEDHPDGPRAMLISQAFWQQEFGGDPNVLEKVVRLNGVPIEIIGVLPPDARFLADAEMWLPLRRTRDEWRGWGLDGIGRLKPGVSIERALEDLTTIHKALIPEFDVNEISSPVVSSLRDRYLGEYRLGSGFLLGAVGIVLLLVCANIAALMFVRSMARGPEMSLRSALGAPRRRILQQLLVEGMVLGLIGACLGAILGVWGSNALVAPMVERFPRWVTFDLDGRFLAFTVGVTLVSALLFALAPALQAARVSGVAGSGGRATSSPGQRRGMGMLITVEVALAMVLLVVGGLSVLDVRELQKVDPGFEPEGLLSYSLSLPSVRYEDSSARLAFIERYLTRLETIPGVESAALASTMPLDGHWGTFFVVDGAPPREDEEANPVVLNRIVSPSYFETVGVRLASGRAFDQFDGREEGTQAIIVNQTFVETHLAHLDDPLGAQITEGTAVGDDPSWMTVVGVARDVKHYGVDEDMRPGVYRPLRQRVLAGFDVALRVRGERAPIVAQARALTAEMDVELPVYGVQAMTDELDQSLWTRRALSWLIGTFSTVALLLAIAGIYGVISYGVGQRTQEISIRMALGAQRDAVLSQVLRRGMTLVAVGVVLGLSIAVAGSNQIAGLLVGVGSKEPVVYIGVTALLLGVAALANYVPAKRAASIDPMEALKGD